MLNHDITISIAADDNSIITSTVGTQPQSKTDLLAAVPLALRFCFMNTGATSQVFQLDKASSMDLLKNLGEP